MFCQFVSEKVFRSVTTIITHSGPKPASDITRETDKGADELVGGRSLADEPRDTAENCAKVCSQNPECDTFSFDPFKVEGFRCERYSGGVLKPIFTEEAAKPSQQGQISAWCPKGSWEKISLYFLSNKIFCQEILQQLFMITPT